MDDAAFAQAVHERLLARDVLAPEELCDRWLEPLVGELRRAYPAVANRDEALIWDAVIRSLLDYAERPAIYQLDRGPLRKFLFFAARGDLLNLLEGERRRATREQRLVLVEDLPEGRNDLVEGNETGPSAEDVALARIEVERLWQLLAPHFPDERDRQLARLYLQDERKSEPYVAILRIGHLDRASQRREVKRHKDRIGKRLDRLREKLRDQSDG